MPRIARGHLEQGFFHVLNRGNHRQMLFRQEEDFAAFLELLSQSVAKFEVKLWSYCLMGNHWHMVTEVAAMTELGKEKVTGIFSCPILPYLKGRIKRCLSPFPSNPKLPPPQGG
jgi:hypothetical protein